jgi:hypothetical protein
MEKGTSWRSDASAAQYADHDYADFAQEFLRRNRDYQSEYASTNERIATNPITASAEEEGLAGRWGLCFPYSTERKSTSRPSTMDARGVARRRRN